MLYGRDVRGPLDILKESWEADKRSDQNIVSYIMLMRERLERMGEEARGNLQEASARQKTWYDREARDRSFQPGVGTITNDSSQAHCSVAGTLQHCEDSGEGQLPSPHA